jgi:hypothetical protein
MSYTASRSMCRALHHAACVVHCVPLMATGDAGAVVGIQACAAAGAVVTAGADCRVQVVDPRATCSDAQVANRHVRAFGWEIAHAAVTRPPISLYAIVARNEGYAYDVGAWDLSIIQGPFSVAPCQTLTLRLATFASPYKSIAELMYPRSLPASFLYIPIRYRFEVSRIKPSLKALDPP